MYGIRKIRIYALLRKKRFIKKLYNFKAIYHFSWYSILLYQSIINCTKLLHFYNENNYDITLYGKYEHYYNKILRRKNFTKNSNFHGLDIFYHDDCTCIGYIFNDKKIYNIFK